MDGITGNNNIFEGICSRLAEYATADSFMAMATSDINHCDFRAECAKSFRSAVQLLDEGHISEDEYNYIVGLAFWIESKTCDYRNAYYAQFKQERKRKNK